MPTPDRNDRESTKNPLLRAAPKIFGSSHFVILLLPKQLGAVIFVSDCSQVLWEQSDNDWKFCVRGSHVAPKYFLLLPILMTYPNFHVFVRGDLGFLFFRRDKNRSFPWLLPNFFDCSQLFRLLPTFLGAVIISSMTESALRINIYILLPNLLGAVIFWHGCSQQIWDQSNLNMTAPKLFGSSHTKIWNVVKKLGDIIYNWEQSLFLQWQIVH